MLRRPVEAHRGQGGTARAWASWIRRSHGGPTGTSGGAIIIWTPTPSARRARQSTTTGATTPGKCHHDQHEQEGESPVATSAATRARVHDGDRHPAPGWSEPGEPRRRRVVAGRRMRPRVGVSRAIALSSRCGRRPVSQAQEWGCAGRGRRRPRRTPVPERSLPGRRTSRWPSAGSTARCTSEGTT